MEEKITGSDELFRLAKEHLYSCLAKNGKLAKKTGCPDPRDTLRSLMEATKDTGSDEGIFALFSILELDGFERSAVTYAFLAAVDPGVADALSELGNEPDRGYLTPYMLSLLWGEGCRVRDVIPYFLKGRILAEEVFGRAASGAGDRLFMDERLIAFLLGDTGADWYAPQSVLLFTDSMPRTEMTEVHRIVELIQRAQDREQHAMITVCGCKGSGKRSRALAVCHLMGAVPVQTLDFSVKGAWENRNALLREALLTGAVPMVTDLQQVWMIHTGKGEFSEFAGRMARMFPFSFLLTEEKLQDGLLAAENVTEYLSYTALPDMERSLEIWREESAGYPIAAETDFFELAGEFRLTPSEIRRALENADIGAFMAHRNEVGMADIKEGCYRILYSAMSGKAVKIRCLYGWDDLVLPEHSKGLLRIACDQVRYKYEVYQNRGYNRKVAYGKGVSMAFSGPPGTGKTMAAQVVGGELGLNVYRVDLAAVVSKYIGETEKNLNEIFESAKKSQVILFFDEADVLFGKRTEVKDSNDKYNNMEAAFLLQKMEEYDGITILATNAIQNFDEAFKRRLRFLIDFPFPGSCERRLIWQKVFPPEQPLGELDLDYLSEKFELSGSNIRNIALHAAFLCAADGSGRLEMKHLVRAVRNEYAKSGKVFTERDAGEYYMLL